jgi:UDP-2,3-diacylglucosamine pyrophosphatase LpxH
MLSLNKIIKAAKGKLKIFNNYRLRSDRELTTNLIFCIPDMHLLEKGINDHFFDKNSGNEQRFSDLLDFLSNLKNKETDMEIIQLGDMYDLWKAEGNSNAIFEAYTNIIMTLKDLNPVYVIGNHDIDLYKRFYKDVKFGRTWRYYSKTGNKLRVIYEHGFQADFFNNQGNWSGTIGKDITKIVNMMEYINPDIEVILGSAWDQIVSIFGKYNVFTPVNDPHGFTHHEYFKFYIDLMEKYNGGKTYDQFGAKDIDLSLAVIGHTHKARLVQMPTNGTTYYLMDCGSWVHGGHEIGVISGKEMAVFQWA